MIQNHQLAQLNSELRALREEVVELREDAARYRFLKYNHAWWMLNHFENHTPYECATNVFDAAIDAAIKETP